MRIELEMRTGRAGPGRADLLRPAGRTGLKRAEKPSKMIQIKHENQNLYKNYQKYTFY